MTSFMSPSRPRTETLVDRQDGGVAEEGYSNLDVDSEEPGCNPEEDEEPEITNGLTSFKMRTVLRRATESRTGSGRGAAMLMPRGEVRFRRSLVFSSLPLH